MFYALSITRKFDIIIKELIINLFRKSTYINHGTELVFANLFEFIFTYLLTYKLQCFFFLFSYFVHSSAVVFGTFLIIPISNSKEGAGTETSART